MQEPGRCTASWSHDQVGTLISAATANIFAKFPKISLSGAL